MSGGTHPSWRSKCSLFGSVAVSNQDLSTCFCSAALWGTTKFHLTQFRMEGYMSMDRSNRKWLAVIAFSLVFAALLVSIPKTPVIAASPPLPGAIFTTDITGGVVNQNLYSAKCGPSGVYLDGGPGPNAPPTAAGLSDGDYYFQVTDPSGKALLSTDPVADRRVTVSGGLFVSAVNHQTFPNTGGSGGVNVELCAPIDIPFLDTPNNGGVYKVWVTPTADFVGDPSKVDNPCGNGCSHGFVHAASKTDNFKVGGQPIACLGVYKFIDANNNGIREPNLGEVRIAHWPIIVKDSNGIELNGTMFTIATKECIFFNVLPGTYTIMEGATNGSGTFVVSSNEVDGTYITPADDTIMVK